MKTCIYTAPVKQKSSEAQTYIIAKLIVDIIFSSPSSPNIQCLLELNVVVSSSTRSRSQLVVFHCSPCGAGRYVGCSDDLDDASSCAREEWRMAESQINMTPECLCLLCWRVFGKPGNRSNRRRNSDGVF